jgi:rubrerythrin
MFSSDPSMITRKEKMDKEEETRAIRGALMAELDAINYYLQQGRLFNEEFIKKVHEDIAKEEITHFGGFLRLLYENSKEDFDYIIKGWNEASKLIGSNVDFPLKVENTIVNKNPEHPENSLESFVYNALQKRKIRKIGKIIKYDEESISVYEIEEKDSEIVQKNDSTTYNLQFLNVQFNIRSDLPLNKVFNVAYKAGLKYSNKEDLTLLSSHPLSLLKSGKRENKSDWEVPGNIANDIIKAKEEIESLGYSDITVILSPIIYSKLFRVYDKSGVYEYELLRHCCEIETSPLITGAVVISKDSFYILEKDEAKVEFLGKEGVYSTYLISGKISPYLIDKNACIIYE